MQFKGRDERPYIGGDQRRFIVVLGVERGFSLEYRPWCAIALKQPDSDLEAVMKEDFGYRPSKDYMKLPCGRHLSVNVNTEHVVGEDMFAVDIKISEPWYF